jgi:hypothetical protein
VGPRADGCNAGRLEADGEQHGVGNTDGYFVAWGGYEVTRNRKKVK